MIQGNSQQQDYSYVDLNLDEPCTSGEGMLDLL